MSEAGIATVAAGVAVLADLGGGTVGGFLAVDTFVDQQPDRALYALERAGEKIKAATYANGQDWNLRRAKERVKEYASIASEKILHNHANLLEEAGDSLEKAKGPRSLKRV